MNVKSGITFTIVIIFLALLLGCATQHKYKKRGAVPCPCEQKHRK